MYETANFDIWNGNQQQQQQQPGDAGHVFFVIPFFLSLCAHIHIEEKVACR
jgi:hypothetical protein